MALTEAQKEEIRRNRAIAAGKPPPQPEKPKSILDRAAETAKRLFNRPTPAVDRLAAPPDNFVTRRNKEFQDRSNDLRNKQIDDISAGNPARKPRIVK
jgi:hypothetical protein